MELQPSQVWNCKLVTYFLSHLLGRRAAKNEINKGLTFAQSTSHNAAKKRKQNPESFSYMPQSGCTCTHSSKVGWGRQSMALAKRQGKINCIVIDMKAGLNEYRFDFIHPRLYTVHEPYRNTDASNLMKNILANTLAKTKPVVRINDDHDFLRWGPLGSVPCKT